jgi:hypothetical protein
VPYIIVKFITLLGTMITNSNIRRNLEINDYILVANLFFLIIMDTCDYKPCSHLGQVAKELGAKNSMWHVQSHQ